MARRFGLDVCEGPPKHHCGANVDDHMSGFVTRNGDRSKLHWRLTSERREQPRLPTRRGLYIFLKHVYFALHPEVRVWPTWRAIYVASRFATDTALGLGVRLGRDAAEFDRSRVKFHLQDPRMRESEEAQAAWRWTEKRYD